MKKTNVNGAPPKTPKGTTGFSKLGKIKASALLRKEEINNLKGGNDGNIIIIDKEID